MLDGEHCLPDQHGAPDFKGLQGAMRLRATDLVVFAFDLLHHDGADLTGLPLVERRRRLVGQAEIRCLHLVPTFEDGAALFAAAEQHDLEGIVSKRRAAPYRSGLTRD